MQPILDSLPDEWEVLIWDNGSGSLRRERTPEWSPMNVLCGTSGGAPSEAVNHPAGWRCSAYTVSDLSVYGRYAAIEYAAGDFCYVQDDDVIVSNSQAIVDSLFLKGTFIKRDGTRTDRYGPRKDCVACNMPSEFRHVFYGDHSLVGFGAAFHRDAPEKAFARMSEIVPTLGLSNYGWWLPNVEGNDHFLRTCDVAFTALTHRVPVDVPKTNLPYAYDADRMYRQQGHQEERARMLELALKVRDR